MAQTEQTPTKSPAAGATSASVEKQLTKVQLDQFCVAVREKLDWERKILDDSLGLVRKWAVEAELVGVDDEGPLRGKALDAVTELRNEARRIFRLDRELANLNEKSMRARLDDADFARMDEDIRLALKYARGSKFGLRAAELKEDNLGVIVSDNVVPESVHRELVKELDLLAAREPKDFHPGSYGMVQDLIHPSLYPYIASVSPLSPDAILPPIDPATNKFRTQMSHNSNEILNSSYAWIPTIFNVSPDGTGVTIESYINGLGTREQYPDLFRLLEKMFLLSLPHFEKTIGVSENYKCQFTPSVQRWEERRVFVLDHEGSLTEGQYCDFLAKQTIETQMQKAEEEQRKARLREEVKEEYLKKEEFYGLGEEFVRSEIYAGKKMKVIVKAANYVLKPGQMYDGSWHMEGMPHERIVASMIYYYDTHPAIEDRGLSFRKFRDEDEDFPSEESHRHDDFWVHFNRPTTAVSSPSAAAAGDDDNDDTEDEYEDRGEDNYPSDWEEDTLRDGTKQPMSTSRLHEFIPLGTVPTTNFDNVNGAERDKGGKSKETGRILSFPNWIQHKVEMVKNSLDPNGNGDEDEVVAARKILCFFLVDTDFPTDYGIPSIDHHGVSIYFPHAIPCPASGSDRLCIRQNVLTTSDVPFQKLQCNKPTFYALLSVISQRATGMSLPAELLEMIWRYCSTGFMTRGEAEVVRRKVMVDRRAGGNEMTFWSSRFSLCEH